MNKNIRSRELGASLDVDFSSTRLDRIMMVGVFIVMIALAGAALWYGGKALVAGIAFAEDRRATAECEKWADEAKVYPGYFLVRWQKMQCDTYGVAVDAPVHDYSSK